MTGFADLLVKPIEGSPDTIAWELGEDFSVRRLCERCYVLAHAGLIVSFVDDASADHFEITGWGGLYLRGEVDVELLRPIPKSTPPY